MRTYTLSGFGIENDTLIAVSTRKFQITQKKQIIELRFKAHQTRLQAELKIFENLAEGVVWIELGGDFKLLVKGFYYNLINTRQNIMLEGFDNVFYNQKQ